MSEPPPLREGGPGLGEGARLGAALVAGWVLHDLVVYLGSGQPGLALRLAPHSLGLIALGAVAGAPLVRWRLALLAAVLLGALLSVAPGVLPIHWTGARLQLPRALLALALALAAARPLMARTALGPLRAGLGLGALACVLLACLAALPSTESLLFGGGALLWLAGGVLRRAGPLVATVGALLALVPAVQRALVDASLERADLAPGAAVNGRAGPNLLLIVLDTVRADRLAPYGYERVTTPNLDAVVRARAHVYTNARSTSSWTLPSHGSLFTGLLPSEHGATHPRGSGDEDTVLDSAIPAQRLRPDVPTLAEILRDAGYRTAAVVSNTAYLTTRYGLDRGFEHYDARPGGLVGDYYPLAQMAWMPVRAGRQVYRDARTITDLSLAWLERAADEDERPFFLSVNYMDAHAPYLPAARFADAFGGEVVAEPWLLKRRHRSILYDRALLTLDHDLARLLAAVDYEDTVVIVTSDHGESLGDHGYWMHNWTLYEDVVRVPLYVMRPGGETGTSDEPLSGADVFRLALETVGVAPHGAAPDDAVFGEWYQTPHKPGAAVLADKHVARDLVAWMDGTRKFIVSSTGEVEVYDLATDPRELEPLPVGEEERAAARLRADTWWREHPPLDTGALGELDAAELERMRKLGYMGGDS